MFSSPAWVAEKRLKCESFAESYQNIHFSLLQENFPHAILMMQVFHVLLFVFPFAKGVHNQATEEKTDAQRMPKESDSSHIHRQHII